MENGPGAVIRLGDQKASAGIVGIGEPRMAASRVESSNFQSPLRFGNGGKNANSLVAGGPKNRCLFRGFGGTKSSVAKNLIGKA